VEAFEFCRRSGTSHAAAQMSVASWDVAKMTYPARSQRKVTSALLTVATAALATGIFVADMLTPAGEAVAGLYVAVVLMATRFCPHRGVVLVAAGCAVLTLVSNLPWRSGGAEDQGVVNALICIAVIGVTTFLALQGRSAEVTLRNQASLLDLTQDTMFVRGMDDVITYWNRGAAELYGWSTKEAVGKVCHQIMRTTFPAPLEQINAELLRTGRWEGELIHTKRDTTRVTVLSRWSLQRDEQGRPATILETNNNITERKQAEERLILLAREVDHRANNLLAVAQAMVQLSKGATVKDLKEAILGRIDALARAHSLIAETGWRGADLERLVERELKPYASGGGGNTLISGVQVELTGAMAQGMAIALHELATNAAKYGAFSTDAGRVEVKWSRTPEGELLLSWSEHGGPVVELPIGHGFGTALIEQTARRQLQGAVDVHWRPGGLACEFRIPYPLSGAA
jgi:PAS domain S-box-containing protein